MRHYKSTKKNQPNIQHIGIFEKCLLASGQSMKEAFTEWVVKARNLQTIAFVLLRNVEALLSMVR